MRSRESAQEWVWPLLSKVAKTVKPVTRFSAVLPNENRSYASFDFAGSVPQGGYSNIMVVREEYVLLTLTAPSRF